jgi:predicted  nucleic acid-binding Zn-ribbon protein
MAQDVSDEVLARLLALQAEDSQIRRLGDRRASLPETARLTEVRDQLAELDADLAIAAKQLEEIGREQNRLEGEIELLEQKISKEEQRLFSGGVSNPKELSTLQAEVEMLKRRHSGLEDELLEVMEQREGAATTESSLRSERAAAAEEEERLTATVAELTTGIDSDLAAHTKERGSVAAQIPDGLLALYEKTRDAKGGIGAAALEGHTCQGCHTELPAREVERLRSERGLQRCDNCRRILVVT